MRPFAQCTWVVGLGLAGLAVVPARGQTVPLVPPAPAAAPPTTSTVTITPLQAAQLLIEGGKIAEAKTVLLALEKTAPDDRETQFLLGLIAVQEMDYPQAIRRFRRILAREPGVVRVRLELARAFFLAKDYDNAERQFRFARAGDVPEAVKANIDGYLSAIRRERRYTVNASVAAAPDSDVNSGPRTDTVYLYGLPFQLSDQARRHSGVGVTATAAGEWSPHFRDNLYGRLGAQINDNTYPGNHAFDDVTVSAYAGPRLLGQRWELSPLLTGYRRWFGNQFYTEGYGAALQGQVYPPGRFVLSGSLGIQKIDFLNAVQNGSAVTAAAGASYAMDPSTAASLSLSASRQSAEQAAYANTAVQLQLGYYRDLRWGFTVSIQPSVAVINYDGVYGAFGVRRRDRLVAAQTTLLNRRIDLYGFTPRLAYGYTWNSSNIPLFAYDRNRVEMGFTRDF
jgi:hypothetical protein